MFKTFKFGRSKNDIFTFSFNALHMHASRIEPFKRRNIMSDPCGNSNYLVHVPQLF